MSSPFAIFSDMAGYLQGFGSTDEEVTSSSPPPQPQPQPRPAFRKDAALGGGIMCSNNAASCGWIQQTVTYDGSETTNSTNSTTKTTKNSTTSTSLNSRTTSSQLAFYKKRASMRKQRKKPTTTYPSVNDALVPNHVDILERHDLNISKASLDTSKRSMNQPKIRPSKSQEATPIKSNKSSGKQQPSFVVDFASNELDSSANGGGDARSDQATTIMDAAKCTTRNQWQQRVRQRMKEKNKIALSEAQLPYPTSSLHHHTVAHDMTIPDHILAAAPLAEMEAAKLAMAAARRGWNPSSLSMHWTVERGLLSMRGLDRWRGVLRHVPRHQGGSEKSSSATTMNNNNATNSKRTDDNPNAGFDIGWIVCFCIHPRYYRIQSPFQDFPRLQSLDPALAHLARKASHHNRDNVVVGGMPDTTPTATSSLSKGNQATTPRGNLLLITDVFVEPAYRGMRLGLRLVNAACQRLVRAALQITPSPAAATKSPSMPASTSFASSSAEPQQYHHALLAIPPEIPALRTYFGELDFQSYGNLDGDHDFLTSLDFVGKKCSLHGDKDGALPKSNEPKRQHNLKKQQTVTSPSSAMDPFPNEPSPKTKPDRVPSSVQPLELFGAQDLATCQQSNCGGKAAAKASVSGKGLHVFVKDRDNKLGAKAGSKRRSLRKKNKRRPVDPPTSPSASSFAGMDLFVQARIQNLLDALDFDSAPHNEASQTTPQTSMSHERTHSAPSLATKLFSMISMDEEEDHLDGLPDSFFSPFDETGDIHTSQRP